MENGANRPSAAESLLVSAVVTAGVVAISELVTLAAASHFEVWRGPRTEFAFQSPWGPITLTVMLLSGASVVQSRRWLLPTLIGLLLLYMFLPPLVWNGPGDLLRAVRPLVDLRLELMPASLVIADSLLYLLTRARHAPPTDRGRGTRPRPWLPRTPPTGSG